MSEEIMKSNVLQIAVGKFVMKYLSENIRNF